MKRIIVACGSGVATSQTVASKVADLLEQRGIDAEVEAVDIKSLDTYIKNCDLYISITPNTSTKFDVPVISGIPFLTGMGMNEALEEVEKTLKG
ncbi:MAG: PTS galactitol transporter subunit IIB [Firmicutes bacterium]|nr:PTS galactitol transporter subunit IIB [Bacillota bacterium]